MGTCIIAQRAHQTHDKRHCTQRCVSGLSRPLQTGSAKGCPLNAYGAQRDPLVRQLAPEEDAAYLVVGSVRDVTA